MTKTAKKQTSKTTTKTPLTLTLIKYIVIGFRRTCKIFWHLWYWKQQILKKSNQMCRSKIFFGGAFSSYLRALSSSSKAPSYCVSAFLHCLYSFVQSLYSLGIIVLLFYHRCTITVTIYHNCIEVVLFYCTVYIALFIHNIVIIICVQFVYHQCNILLLLAFQCTFI